MSIPSVRTCRQQTPHLERAECSCNAYGFSDALGELYAHLNTCYLCGAGMHLQCYELGESFAQLVRIAKRYMVYNYVNPVYQEVLAALLRLQELFFTSSTTRFALQTFLWHQEQCQAGCWHSVWASVKCLQGRELLKLFVGNAFAELQAGTAASDLDVLATALAIGFPVGEVVIREQAVIYGKGLGADMMSMLNLAE